VIITQYISLARIQEKFDKNVSTAIVYHTRSKRDCLDGYVGAWVCKRYFVNGTPIACSYGEPAPDLSDYDQVVCVDFTFTYQETIEIAELGLPFMVIDHHKDKMLGLLGSGVNSRALLGFDNSESAATLAWKTLFPDEQMPEFLRYVRDRDLFQKQLPYTEPIFEAMYTKVVEHKKLGLTCFEYFDTLSRYGIQELITELLPYGEELLANKNQRVDYLAEGIKRHTFLGHAVASVELQENDFLDLTSDVCCTMYTNNPDLDFVYCYHLPEDNPGNVYLSLRSNSKGSNFDTAKISAAYGGGGHRNASGCGMTSTQYQAAIKM
jgi:oligoribonuclease NrnB/cAMP/cGMP phosphodiesterase (DHH superfamily)